MSRRFTIACALVVVACGPAAAPAPAPAPIAERVSPYDEAFASMTAFVRERGDAGGCFVAEYGTCGALRYLDEIPGGLLGTTRYFDASGKLVATFSYNVEHPGSKWDGPKQTCARSMIDDLCRPKK